LDKKENLDKKSFHQSLASSYIPLFFRFIFICCFA
jgi:hypothetical protein